MGTAVSPLNPVHTDENSLPPQVFPEDSTILKVISCVPLLGMRLSYSQEHSLLKKISRENNVPQLVRLINLRNDYKMANVIRSIFSAILCILEITFGVCNATFVICTCIFVVLAGVNIYMINKNNLAVGKLLETSNGEGIQIY